MRAIVIGEPAVTHDAGTTLTRCTVSIPGRPERDLWIRTGVEDGEGHADSFVALGLLPAMKLGIPLVSRAPVSRRLLHLGIPEIQRIHEIWRDDPWGGPYPRFRTVEVDAPAEERRRGAGGVGLFFSGGVDSSFSLYDAPDPVTDLLFIEDFEAPFPADQGSRAVAGVRTVAEAYGKELVLAQTNARSVFSEFVSWAHFHGAFLAAVALQMQGRLTQVRVPSSGDVRDVRPWGSHPLVDPLWSTEATEICYDRLDVTRMGKTAAIARDDVLLRNLRVCWAPHHNCGYCPKCVRTIFALQALGLYVPGEPFSRPPLTARDVSRLDLREERAAKHFQEVADYLDDRDERPDLVGAVRVARNGRYHRGVGRLLRGHLLQRTTARVRRRVGGRAAGR